MKKALKRQKTVILASWVVFMFFTYLFYSAVEQKSYYEKAEENLLAQAQTIIDHIPLLAENDYYTQTRSKKIRAAKLKTLEYALEPYDDLADAKELLDDFAQAAGVEALVIYDRNGDALYRSRPDADPGFSKDVYVPMLDSGGLNKSDAEDEYPEDYVKAVLSDASTNEPQEWSLWGVKGKWIVCMQEMERSHAQQEILDYFSWANALQRIRVGSDGFLLAVDSQLRPGTILSYRDRKAAGKPVEELDIFPRGENTAASLDRLLTIFADPGLLERITVEGTDYYAARVDIDGMLLLALLPMEEVSSSAREMAGILFLLTALATGLLMLYALFHVGERKPDMDTGGQSQWGKRFLLRLQVRGVLTVAAVLVFSLLLSTLSLYADTFSYCQRKVEDIVTLLENNNAAYLTLENWANEENLTKCRIAECVLEHTDESDIDWQFLDGLSERLGVKSVYIFDREGAVTATNSAYDRLRIDGDSPFSVLLEGQPFLVGDLEFDTTSNECMQRVGISMLDSGHHFGGAVLVTVDSLELLSITDNLTLNSVSEQICLKDRTVVLDVNEDESGDMLINYIAEVSGGAFLPGMEGFDYTGMSVSVLDISKERLRDNYNGNMLVLKNQFFASVRRTSDDYILVMRPQVTIGRSQIFPVTISVAAAFAYALLLALIVAGCVKTRQEGSEGLEEAAPLGPQKKSVWKPLWKEESSTLIASLMGLKNPYFEERWPNDGVRWRDKTLNERYSTLSRWILVLALTALFIEALLSGKNSIWYYCVTGEWDSGINLYSVTMCVLAIIILMVVKLAGHSLLFLIASAVDAKGETICHLMDSFLGYVLFVAGIFICLSNVGVDANTLTLTGGVAGVVFGIGCQNLVADILAGIIMTFEGVVRVGDIVDYNGIYGTVLLVGVRTTQIKSYGDLAIVRNNDLKNFINKTTSHSDTRIRVYLNVDLRESLERIEEIIERELPVIHDSIEKRAGAKVDGPVYLGVNSINESGMSLYFMIFGPLKAYIPMLVGLNRELKLMCDRNNIRIALPQLEVRGQGTGMDA